MKALQTVIDLGLVDVEDVGQEFRTKEFHEQCLSTRNLAAKCRLIAVTHADEDDSV